MSSTLAERTEPELAAPPEGERPSDVWGLVRLGVVVAVIVAVFLAFGLGALVLVIGAILFMVVFHEFGHFIAAKWAGMKATQFFVGFGPPLWSIRRGETEYGVKPILLGGYVKIIGMSSMEEVDAEDEPRSYRRQAFHKRIIVALAGPLTHVILALLLAWVAVVAFGVASPSVKIAGFTPGRDRPRTPPRPRGCTGRRDPVGQRTPADLGRPAAVDDPALNRRDDRPRRRPGRSAPQHRRRAP